MKKIFTLILAAVLLIGTLAACGGGAAQGGATDNGGTASGGTVNVYNWGEYIDREILDLFTEETGIKVNYKTFETNEQLYSVLRQGGVSYDVIIPSDYMISRLIAEDMLEKLDLDNIPNLSLIDDKWSGMEYDPTGEYSVPYMWGTVGIIYDPAVTGEVSSWSALFNEALSGNILMFDNSRDAFGIALKCLGYSLNTKSEAELTEAYELLARQKPLLQAYVMDQIFDKLEGSEAAIGPYYAGDYLSMLENNPDLSFVIPMEGSNVFVDAMCVPKGAKNKTNAEAFIDFMCRTDIALMNAEYVGYTSPNVEVEDLIELDELSRSVMYPNEDVLSRCQFFVNLPQETLELYDRLWAKLKA